MAALLGVAVVIFGIYIFDYYRKEKRRKQREEYNLYKIIFEKDGETYFQIIGAMSEQGAKQIFYQDPNNLYAEILEIEIRSLNI